MAEMNTGPPLTPRGSYTLRGYGGGYLDTFLVAKEHFKEQVSLVIDSHWTPSNVFYFCVGFTFLVFLWKQYLMYRQYRVYVLNEFVPPEVCILMEQKYFAKARAYRIDLTRFAFVHETFSRILTLVVLSLNIGPKFWDYCGHLVTLAGYSKKNELLTTAVFVLIGSFVSTLIGLPWDLYGTFKIEEKHGFNKMTLKFYAWDKIKKFIVSQLITLPILCGMVQIVKVGGDLFFVYLWAFMFMVTLLVMTIYPDFIAPLFDKFSPLPEGKLRNEIEAVAASLEYPLKQLYIVEQSKRSAHSNAYLYGMFSSKKIVLFDTLLKGSSEATNLNENTANDNATETEGVDEPDDHGEPGTNVKRRNVDSSEEKGDDLKKCTDDEIVAIICHELGHWKMWHVTKRFVILHLHMLFSFIIFASLYQNATIYKAFGFDTDKPILIGMLLILEYIFSPYNVFMDFLLTYYSRKQEFEADDFARKMHRASYLRQALINLNKDNLGFPLNDPLYSAWHHSHPPLQERIQALGKNE
ncbi:CAAX prenyl protease 1 homolog [Varroa jacobsoni]|uniref:CAAX prenyl protease 1 homolog n=1 Tax=Varroa jacobsoni TaxID=62625 RepID=UPI000BF6A96D|nr:CAAX prenyl protease 1 homolog [Varroa jacobsoni]XP_022705547.1 CAAX prenyl protease 1 homolog [Varroa jacobsoni]